MWQGMVYMGGCTHGAGRDVRGGRDVHMGRRGRGGMYSWSGVHMDQGVMYMEGRTRGTESDVLIHIERCTHGAERKRKDVHLEQGR